MTKFLDTGPPLHGTSTVIANTLCEYLEGFMTYSGQQPYARGESRQYPRQWTPTIWREDHAFQDRTPITATAYLTRGEVAALEQCRLDQRSGEIGDAFFERVHGDLIRRRWPPGSWFRRQIDVESQELFFWASLAQHYNREQRYPTRLLDVTSDPLVALYFATSSDEDRDGFVWILVDQFNDISHQPATETASSYLDILRIAGSDAAGNYHLDDDTLTLMRSPLPSNTRMVAQRGAFIWARGTGLESYRQGGLVVRIPAEAKQELRHGLSRLGITRAALFPTST